MARRRSADHSWWREGVGGMPGWAVIAVAIVAVIGAGAILLPRLSASDAAAPAPVPAATGISSASTTPTPQPQQTDLVAVDVRVGDDATILIFGDSWTQGFGATEDGNGIGRRMLARTGWDGEFNGIGGSGYLNTGTSGRGNFLQRLLALQPGQEPDVIVVQGSINDMSQDFRSLPPAAADFIDVARYRFPNAQIVMVAPFNPKAQPDPRLIDIDRMLQKVALAKQVAFISPIQEGWTTDEVAKTLINESNQHPNDEGYDYFTGKLVDALTD